jgi:hypothetical protein
MLTINKTDYGFSFSELPNVHALTQEAARAFALHFRLGLLPRNHSLLRHLLVGKTVLLESVKPYDAWRPEHAEAFVAQGSERGNPRYATRFRVYYLRGQLEATSVALAKIDRRLFKALRPYLSSLNHAVTDLLELWELEHE